MSNLYQIVSQRKRNEAEEQRRLGGGRSLIDDSSSAASAASGILGWSSGAGYHDDVSLPPPTTIAKRGTSMGSSSHNTIGTTSEVSGLTMDMALLPTSVPGSTRSSWASKPRHHHHHQQQDEIMDDECTTVHSNSVHTRLAYNSSSSLVDDDDDASSSSHSAENLSMLKPSPAVARNNELLEAAKQRTLREAHKALSMIDSVAHSPHDTASVENELEEAKKRARQEAHKALSMVDSVSPYSSSFHSSTVQKQSPKDDPTVGDAGKKATTAKAATTTTTGRRHQPKVPPRRPSASASPRATATTSEPRRTNDTDKGENIKDDSSSEGSTVNEDDFAFLTTSATRAAFFFRHSTTSARVPPSPEDVASDCKSTKGAPSSHTETASISEHGSPAAVKRTVTTKTSEKDESGYNKRGDALLVLDVTADTNADGDEITTRDLPAVAAAADDGRKSDDCCPQYKRFGLMLVLGIMVALIALVAMSIVFVSGKNEDDEDHDGDGGATFGTSETPPSSSSLSSSAPSVPASPSPTPSIGTLLPIQVTGITTTEELSDLLAAESFDGGLALQTSGTAQNSALQWLAEDPQLALRTESNLIQRYALAVLYYSTNGEEWSVTRQPFLSHDQDVCDWYATLSNNSEDDETSLCVKDGINVDRLELRNASLEGRIPPEVALLSLDTLILSDNLLSGSLPTQLFGTNTPNKFDVHGNNLESTIPTEIGLAGTSTLLSHLDFSSNILTGKIPSELGLLTMEQQGSVLWFFDNDLTGAIPSELANVVGIDSWYFHDLDGLEGTMPSELCSFVEEDPLGVRELTVGCNSNVECDCCTDDCIQEDNDVPFVLDLEELLSGVSFDDGIAVQTIGTPQNAAYQWLQKDPNIDSRRETDVIQRYALAVLYYSTNGDSWLLSQQSFLSYDVDVCDWYSTTTLHEGVGGGEGEDSSICTDDGEIRILALANLTLDGFIPPELGLLSELEVMGMNHNNLGGSLPNELFYHLTSLSYLNMYNNLLTSTIPTLIGMLSDTLKVVNLDANLLGGQIVTEMGLLANLEMLVLSSNDLTGTIPTELGECTSLQELHMLNNEGLTGSISDEICALVTLQELRVGCESNVECDCCTDVCVVEDDGGLQK